MRIADCEIGTDQPCRFIVEVSNSHNGSLDRAIRMIDTAADIGADFVKFQCFSPQELVDLRGDGPAPEPWGSQGWGVRDLYEKARTPFHWFAHLFKHARKRGIVPFASFFGRESFAVLQSVDSPAYKLASLDRAHTWLRDLALSVPVPVLASVPTAEEARDARVLYLYCPPGYPQTDIAFSRRWFIEDGMADFADPWFMGFSYHGTDPRPCITAASLGANLIEAHFQLDDEPSELEANVSLTASQFAQLISDVRATEVLLAD